jgi:adenylate kinase
MSSFILSSISMKTPAIFIFASKYQNIDSMKKINKVLVILGTPGVGKTTFAKKLSKKTGARLIEANKVIEEYKLYSGFDKFGTKIVKMKELERVLNKLAKDGNVIIEGHILADIKIKGAIAIVLREHLQKIYKRLKARGYPDEKILENIESEALDYSGINAEKNYREVYEFFSRDKKLMEKVIDILNGKKVKKESIELLEELIPFITKSSR